MQSSRMYTSSKKQGSKIWLMLSTSSPLLGSSSKRWHLGVQHLGKLTCGNEAEIHFFSLIVPASCIVGYFPDFMEFMGLAGSRIFSDGLRIGSWLEATEDARELDVKDNDGTGRGVNEGIGGSKEAGDGFGGSPSPVSDRGLLLRLDCSRNDGD